MEKQSMFDRCIRTPRPPWSILLFLLLGSGSAVWAQPSVVPTAEGQIGDVPEPLDQMIASRFEPVRGTVEDVLLGGIFVFGGIAPPPPAMQFLTDQIHIVPSNPASIGDIPALFDNGNVAKLPPASARSRNAADDGDLVAFTFAADGPTAQTMTINVATFDEAGAPRASVPIDADNTFPFPDPGFAKTGVAVDDQGRVTVVYSELPMGGAPRVRAQRFDGLSGLPIGSIIDVNPFANDAAVALLDPAGNRLIVPSADGNIKANIVDLSGGSPVVQPELPVSTTPAIFANLNPVVATDPATGVATIVWENISGLAGDPVNIRARRFDAMGNPVGNDFQVNTTTANAQGQAAVTYGPQGTSVVVWAGDAAVAGDELDVFFQAYGADGNPIGTETRANSATAEVQDQPTVRFLPEPDTQGRPQFVVAWRDVGFASGTFANGTGTSYKCFSIEGLDDPSEIFADGFESGDTSSWSATQP